MNHFFAAHVWRTAWLRRRRDVEVDRDAREEGYRYGILNRVWVEHFFDSDGGWLWVRVVRIPGVRLFWRSRTMTHVDYRHLVNGD